MHNLPQKNRGFTVLELLVVIGIIGTLSTMVIASTRTVKAKAQIAATLHEIKTMQTAFDLYYFDTETIPPRCRRKNGQCTKETDPFINSLGVKNWGGPYEGVQVYDRVHQWGGHIGIEQYDVDGDGKNESFLVLDDDPPVGFPADTGQIPRSIIKQIDEKIDDGNTDEGNFRAGVPNVSVGEGSAVWMLYNP